MVVAFWLVASALAGDVERGALLAGVGGCASCHTAAGGEPFAGGYAIETEWGTFYGSNLTPDLEHGLGSWSEGDFVRAMREGRAPEGHSYYPAFPFAAFTGMTDGDLADLWAFLATAEPVARPEVAHEPSALAKGRWKLGLWRLKGFTEGPMQDADRGQYLVEAVAHCGECHTPRGAWGVPKRRRALEEITGRGWTEVDWTRLLERGALPDGDYVGGEMADVVEHGTSQLSDADRAAMARWLMAVE